MECLLAYPKLIKQKFTTKLQRAKITKIRPELTRLRSYGDTAGRHSAAPRKEVGMSVLP
jgi:hypothetical protein